MVHTAEDLTTLVLLDLNQPMPDWHSDLPHGFVLEYKSELTVDLTQVEQQVKQLIRANLPVTYFDQGHIKIADRLIPCTGPPDSPEPYRRYPRIFAPATASL